MPDTEVFDPLDPAHNLRPDELLRASRATCPVSQPREGLHVLTTDAQVRDVFAGTYSSRGNFSMDPGDLELPHLPVTNLDPPEHPVLRTRLLKSFAPVRLRRLRPAVEAIVGASAQALPESGVVDLYPAYVEKIPAAVLYAFIGIPQELWEQAQEYGDVVVNHVPAPPQDLPEFGALLGLIGSLVGQRRAQPDQRHEDVLDNLCFADDGGQELSDTEVVVHTFQLVVAATDTTRSLIASCLHRLLSERELWERVLADRSLLPQAIEESLRLDSPATFMIRTALEDQEILGRPVAKGDKLYLSLQSANRDEERWGTDAERFVLPRPDGSDHVAFGRGAHTCIGATLARMEATTAVAALMDRFPRMSLVQPHQPPQGVGALSRRPSGVRVDLADAAPVPT